MKDKVGQGAHGVVYQCSENNTGETYAAKVMLGDDERIRIAKRTYSIMKLFNDESIVKGRELFIDEHKDLIYVVMEYCPYPSLKALLKERKLTYSERKIVKV
jgi:serine/threonine protein kinase